MKNKEIEELLSELKRRKERYNYCKNNDISFSDEDYKSYLLLSYIEQLENLCNKYEQEHKTTFEIWKKDIKKLEQLEKELKEEQEDNYKQSQLLVEKQQKIEQLENNRDKAIELLNKLETQPAYLDCKYYELYGFNEIKNILMGDSE